MRQHVVYILDLSMTLTFDLRVAGDILSDFYSQFLSCSIKINDLNENLSIYEQAFSFKAGKHFIKMKFTGI